MYTNKIVKMNMIQCTGNTQKLEEYNISVQTILISRLPKICQAKLISPNTSIGTLLRDTTTAQTTGRFVMSHNNDLSRRSNLYDTNVTLG
jgi:hypothetical protein